MLMLLYAGGLYYVLTKVTDSVDVFSALKEVYCKTLPPIVVPNTFPVTNNYPYPLHEAMAILHGGMLFDM